MTKFINQTRVVGQTREGSKVWTDQEYLCSCGKWSKDCRVSSQVGDDPDVQEWLCESCADASFYEEDTEVEEEEEDLEKYSDEPCEDDLQTEDHMNFYQYGKLVLTIDEDDDMVLELRKHMDKNQFWPSVFWISDHGNAHLIDMSHKKEADEVPNV